jgi:uncharacterized protein YjiS (DUF1127 family)
MMHGWAGETALKFRGRKAYVATQQSQGRLAIPTPRRPWPPDGHETMSAPIGKSEFSFELPNLSYVHASLEEPSLSEAPAFTQRPDGLGAWLARRIAGFNAWRQQQVALGELEMMSEHELADIGLSRSDLPRVFDADHNLDLLQRGAAA